MKEYSGEKEEGEGEGGEGGLISKGNPVYPQKITRVSSTTRGYL